MRIKAGILGGIIALGLLGMVSVSTASTPNQITDDVAVQGAVSDAPMSTDFPDDVQDPSPMTDCFMCGSGSSGQCAPQSGKSRIQCTGSRSECRDRGCRITGTASCSSSGNVGSC